MGTPARHRHIDTASTVTIVVTLVLFTASMFEKGLTHDALLEIGVFLVSVKLILSTHKNELVDRENKATLARIEAHVSALRTAEVEPAPHDIDHGFRGDEPRVEPRRASS